MKDKLVGSPRAVATAMVQTFRLVKRVEHDMCDRHDKCPQQVLCTTAALLPTPLGPSREIVSAVSSESKLFHVLRHTRAILQGSSVTQMSLLPVCCVADFDSKFLDRFLELNAKEKEGLDLDLNIVIITDLSKTYTEISKSPMNGTCSPAPFQGRSAGECFELLQEFARDTGSEIDVEIFAILDERSRDDDTVCIVKASKTTGEIKTVHGALRQTDMSLVNLWVGNLNIEECSYEFVD